MARPRKPTRVLELKGAFRHDPQRRRDREGEPEPKAGLGKAPDTLDEAERARWNEIAKWASWLTVADRVIVEQTCRLWMLERKGKSTAAQSKQLASNLGRLGMTPSDRSKVKVPVSPVKKKNPFRALTA